MMKPTSQFGLKMKDSLAHPCKVPNFVKNQGASYIRSIQHLAWAMILVASSGMGAGAFAAEIEGSGPLVFEKNISLIKEAIENAKADAAITDKISKLFSANLNYLKSTNYASFTRATLGLVNYGSVDYVDGFYELQSLAAATKTPFDDRELSNVVKLKAIDFYLAALADYRDRDFSDHRNESFLPEKIGLDQATTKLRGYANFVKSLRLEVNTDEVEVLHRAKITSLIEKILGRFSFADRHVLEDVLLQATRMRLPIAKEVRAQRHKIDYDGLIRYFSFGYRQTDLTDMDAWLKNEATEFERQNIYFKMLRWPLPQFRVRAFAYFQEHGMPNEMKPELLSLLSSLYERVEKQPRNQDLQRDIIALQKIFGSNSKSEITARQCGRQFAPAN